MARLGLALWQSVCYSAIEYINSSSLCLMQGEALCEGLPLLVEVVTDFFPNCFDVTLKDNKLLGQNLLKIGHLS